MPKIEIRLSDEGDELELAVPRQLESELRERVPTTAGRVLVVDDDVLVLSMTERALTRFGFAVTTVSDGHAAMDLFREQPEAFDLVLLDLTMPQLSGFQVFAGLRAIRPEVCVVFTSGYSIDLEDGAGIPEGAAAFVRKPFLPSELVATLREVLARYGASSCPPPQSTQS